MATSRVDRRRPGRRQAIGKLVVDESRGRLGINAGYCYKCGEKHLMDREEIDELVRWARKDERSRMGRLFRWLIESRLV